MNTHTHTQRPRATLRFEVDGLLEALGENSKFEWISNRIQRLWPQWSMALETLQSKKPFSHTMTNVSLPPLL